MLTLLGKAVCVANVGHPSGEEESKGKRKDPYVSDQSNVFAPGALSGKLRRGPGSKRGRGRGGRRGDVNEEDEVKV
jgi:hypothetical protein